MNTSEIAPSLARLFRELTEGTTGLNGAFILNTGDVGLLRSLDALSADEASASANGGASIAAHAQHVRYGLSLMNRWAREGGNPFADATWDDAWELTRVDVDAWTEIRRGLQAEIKSWREALASPRDVHETELLGMIGSIGHLAYHLGAIRQVAARARGPKEGTF